MKFSACNTHSNNHLWQIYQHYLEELLRLISGAEGTDLA